MKRLTNKSLIIIVALISIIIGMFLATISFNEGFKSGRKFFALAQSKIANDPDVQQAIAVQRAFRKVVKLLKPAVVNIYTETVVKQTFFNDPFFRFFGHDFFDEFFGTPQERESILRALGSGFIIDKDGYILSNLHVVENADKIKVKLYNGKEYKAKIVGIDKKTDLALLKIKTKDKLFAAPIGDSDSIEIGDWVIAIGNPFGLSHTFTIGIVSAKGRSGIMSDTSKYENFIQTDAAINRGNSGGPLVNIKGEVIGINTAIYSPSGGNIGIGFAIPINMAKSVFEQLKTKGKVSRGYLGITIQDLTPELAKHFDREPNSGVLVADVLKNTPAYKAGLKSGDIIIEYNGKKINNSNQLRNMVAETSPGTKVKIKIVRNKRKKVLTVKLSELPEEGSVASVEESSKLWLGMKVSNITPTYIEQFNLDDNEKGVIITFVKPNSIAHRSGLKIGDIIKKINNTIINNFKDFKRFIKKHKKDKDFLLVIKRGGRLFYLPLEKEE